MGPTVGSDHLPIIIDVETGGPPTAKRRGPAKMSLKKASWDEFERLVGCGKERVRQMEWGQW